MVSQCVWNNKTIKYVPGKIMARVFPGADRNKAMEIINECGGKIDCIHDYGIDIATNLNDTINVAKKISSYKEIFSFVSPEIF